MVGTWSDNGYLVWPVKRRMTDVYTSALRGEIVPFTLQTGLWRHQWSTVKWLLLQTSGCQFMLNKSRWVRVWLWGWNVPHRGFGLCKDVQMIHRVQCRVSSGHRNSVGDQRKGLSSTSLFTCDLTMGMTTNKLLCFHFMLWRWPGMKAWLVATAHTVLCSQLQLQPHIHCGTRMPSSNTLQNPYWYQSSVSTGWGGMHYM